MPRQDGTGPAGNGPATGRGLGNCQKPTQGNQQPCGQGKGLKPCGGGRGFCGGVRGQGGRKQQGRP